MQAKNESPVAPDSTTVDRIMFTKNEDVLLHDEHGLFIFGTVIQVTAANPNKLKLIIHFKFV